MKLIPLEQSLINLIRQIQEGEIVIKIHKFDIKDIFKTEHYKPDELIKLAVTGDS